MLNLIHAVPKSFFPEVGGQLSLRGLEEAEAIRMLKDSEFKSYVRNYLCCQVLSSRLGVKVKPRKRNCPPPTADNPTIIGVPIFSRALDQSETLSEEEALATPIKWMLAELS